MKKRLQKIIAELNPNEDFYYEKLKLLGSLVGEPDVGHIIPDEIVDWCESVGLKPECNHEDRSSWWTCDAI